MKLITKAQRETLLGNGICTQENPHNDPKPVIKLFTPDANCTWLLSELDPDDNDIAFGLCDLGMGSPELGSVRISELEQLRGRLGLPVERDLHFTAEYPLSIYSRAARTHQAISENTQSLAQAAAANETSS